VATPLLTPPSEVKTYTRKMVGPTFLLLVLLGAMPSSVASSSAAREDFTVFLKKFIANQRFRAQRVVTPLPADLRSDCADSGVEKWGPAEIRKNLVVPLSRRELEAEYLTQDITEVSGTEISLFQFREEADSYLITYTFRLRNGRWYLVAYQDASC
jgi:hypothetical protein